MTKASDSSPADGTERRAGSGAVPMSWMIADLKGEERTLGWYIDHAEQGDRAAALRALRLCMQSLTPAALAQNGIRMPHDLADALRRIIGPAAHTGDSAVMRAARGSPLVRIPDANTTNIAWWRCYEMHKLLKETPGLSQIKAAAKVLEGENGGEPASLQKRYRALRPQLEIYFRENEADAEK